MTGIMQNIISALSEKEEQINSSPHQNILIKIRDNKIIICGNSIFWKPKEN
jgi:hypothetical protein